MEYVAEELGVEPVLHPGAPARDLAARSTPPPCAGCCRLIRELRPDILHTHTAKAGAVGRVGRAARRRGAAAAWSSTPSTATSCAATSARRRREAFRRVEQALARGHRRADRRQPRGARRPGRARRRAGREDHRHPARPRPGPARSPRRRTRARRSGASSASPADAFVVGWLGRMTEIKRADDLLAASPGSRPAAARRTSLLVGDGPLRPELEALARRARHRRTAATSPASASDVGALYAAARRRRADLGERGDARLADRGAGRRATGRLDRRRRRPRRRHATARPASSSPPGDVDGDRRPARPARRGRDAASAMGEAGREVVRRDATRSRGSCATSTLLYRELLEQDARARGAARARAAPRRRAPAARAPAPTPPADPARLAVLPARDRGDPVAHAVVRRVPRRPRP